MEAGFHQIPSLPGFMATMAWPIPTACAPVGNRRKSEPSLPVGVWARECPATNASNPTLKRSCLIDQHNGDVVAHGVPEPALVTKKDLLGLPVFELGLALWTDEDFQETRRQAHLLFPVAS